MRIIQLVGNLAGTVVDMDYAEATACIACGTARALTKNEEQAPVGADIAQWNADHATAVPPPRAAKARAKAGSKRKRAPAGKSRAKAGSKTPKATVGK